MKTGVKLFLVINQNSTSLWEIIEKESFVQKKKRFIKTASKELCEVSEKCDDLGMHVCKRFGEISIY
jgi:hypothetical protein